MKLKRLLATILLAGTLGATGIIGTGCAPAPPADLAAIVHQVWSQRPDEWGLVDCIINKESHWDPNAISPTSDYGLFQIHLPLHQDLINAAGGNWADPRENTLAAWFLSSGGTNMRAWHGDCGL